MFRHGTSIRQSLALFLILLLLSLGVAGSALAAQPEEADPDPEAPISAPVDPEPASSELDPSLVSGWLQDGWSALLEWVALDLWQD